MKNIRLYPLLAFLLMAGGVTMQGQEYPVELATIYSSEDVWIKVVKSIDENAFLAFGGSDVGSRVLMKMTYDGEILGSIGLPNNRLEYWGQGNFMNGKFRYVSFRADDNDTLPLLCVVDVDPNDLSLINTGYNWEGLDFDHPTVTEFYRNMIHYVFSKDGSLTISYPVDSLWMFDQKEAMHLVQFNSQGDVSKERIFYDLRECLTNYFFSVPDSLGYRLILMNPDHYAYDCHTLDKDLNTISVVEDAGMVYYSNSYVNNWPYYCIHELPCLFGIHPYNGRTYSVGCETPFESNGEMDVIMGVYDEQFQQLGWTWGLTNPRSNDEGFGMCFGEQGEIYVLGWMDIRTGWNLYVGVMDEDLNKLSEIYFIPENYNLGPLDIAVCPDGGCIVCSNRSKTTGYVDYCIFRITPEDFWNVEEAHSHGFAVATAYPNPDGNTLNIRTALQNAIVEVYDINGRLIHSQALTENVTEIDATDWGAGVYVWKVYTGVSAGSTTLAETGKWIKELDIY